MGSLDSHPVGFSPTHGHHRRSGADGETPGLEAVLETECVALMALEATNARIRILPGDHRREQADISGAIELLRHAIGELRLRLGRDRPNNLLALGFVAPREDLA